MTNFWARRETRPHARAASRSSCAALIASSVPACAGATVHSGITSVEAKPSFGQISLITKSGTNHIHGALFEFWRNNVFDARYFFLPKPSRLNRNQFGGMTPKTVRSA